MPRTSTSRLHALADAWVRRGTRPDPGAVQAAAGLAPAVVVTGASRGIGRALAEAFAAKGDAVVLVARHPGPLADAVAGIKARDPAAVALPVALDVTEPLAFQQLSASLAAEQLYLDVLVNNAGLGLSGRFEDQSVTDLDKLVALNVTALTRLMRLALPGMIGRARGGILNVASLAGYVPGPYQAAYYASKAYVVSLTRALAHECAGTGVRIAVVAPGPVETRFHAAMGADAALYRVLLPSQSPKVVASAARRGFVMGRRVIVPGLINGLGGVALQVLPHTITVPLLAWLLRPPTVGQREKKSS